jgi:hypothetical protein
MSESFQEEMPEELKYKASLILSPRRLLEVIKQRREYYDEKLVLRPLNDRGGPVGIYSGPSGPIVTLARIQENIRHGRPAGEGLPPDPLNDPNSP